MSNILNIEVDQGCDYTFTFNFLASDNSVIDTSGYDARLQVRRSYGNTSWLINATLMNGKLVMNSGFAVWNLSAADTTAIRFADKEAETEEFVYDLEIISPLGQVFKPARGTLIINREVTR